MNNVHYERRQVVNTVITSREEILRTSRELISRQGWNAVNIRAVAAACNISVGSVYNYFSSKSELIAAAVESVWCDIFHFPEDEKSFERFTDCVEWMFACMRRGDEKYPGFFSLHSMSFIGEEKAEGQQMMAQSWDHIRKALYAVLMKDKNINRQAFDPAFTAEKFVEIIFSLVISALVRRDYDCSGILGLIRRTIY